MAQSMNKHKYPLFQASIRKLIAQQRMSASAFARHLNLNPGTVIEWTNGRRMPKRFLREIIKEMFGDAIVYDDENTFAG